MNSSVVHRSANHIACDMGEETVVLDMASGTYYGLDAVAARVWTLIEQPMTLRAIHEAIVAEYDVDAVSCRRDIVAFLDRMQAIGLVHISDGPAA
jgi:hypothetical protein